MEHHSRRPGDAGRYVAFKNMNEPNSTVLSFIRKYFDWNARSNERCKALANGSVESQQAIATSEMEYAELVSEFCTDSVTPQPISFGDDPMHSPDSEIIKSVDIAGANAVVRTANTGAYNFVSDYEYHLQHVNNQWRIESVLYVDEDGRYECL